MANPYYTFSPSFLPGTKVRSDAINTQLAAIESAFDLFPANPSSATRGVSTFGTEAQGATVNDYVVTMPNTRLTNQEGDEVTFKATHTNAGASTLNIDGIGAVPFVAFDGSPLSSGNVVLDRYYTARYDNTNTRFMLTSTATGGTGSADHGALSGLLDDDHPQYGALAQNENVAGNWNFLAGLDVFNGTPLIIYRDTEASGVSFSMGASNTLTVVTTGSGDAIEFEGFNDFDIIGGAVNIWNDAFTHSLTFSVDVSGNSLIESFATVTVDQNTSIGTSINSHTLDVYGVTTIHAATANALVVGGSATVTTIQLADNAGTVVGFLSKDASDNLVLSNRVNGGTVQIRCDDTGGTNRTGLVWDPDVNLTLTEAASGAYQDVLRTVASASGGVEVRNLASGSGYERVLTTSDSNLLQTQITGLHADVQTFTPGSSTWTKPAGAQFVEVILVGGGGGGGSGRKGATGAARSGGSGGGGAGRSKALFLATTLAATEAVVVGAGGAGGASQTNASTPGSVGIDGGLSSFGTAGNTAYVVAAGGGHGLAGGTGTITGGGGGDGDYAIGLNGGTGTTSTGGNGVDISAAAVNTGIGCGGGGGGAGTTGAGTTGNGGFSSRLPSLYSAGAGDLPYRAAGGATNTSGGVGGSFQGAIGAGGGGGGAGVVSGAGAFVGGAGGSPGGGGGGGGVGIDGASNSAAGGAGGAGVVVVITTF